MTVNKKREMTAFDYVCVQVVAQKWKRNIKFGRVYFAHLSDGFSITLLLQKCWINKRNHIWLINYAVQISKF